MSTIDITMKKIYGLNRYDDKLEFKSNVKHNFIYGVNAIGKTSFSKGIELLIENKQYRKLMDTDSDEYFIDFVFDDLHESMDNSIPFNLNNDDLNKRIFVFTKRYLNQHVSLINSDSSNIQIGIRIAEREKYINEVDNIVDNFQKIIFESLKTYNLKTTKEGFIDSSSILKLKSTSKFKEKERSMKQTAFESLMKMIEKPKNTIDYSVNTGDFNGNNLKIMINLKQVLKRIIDQVNEIINKNFEENIYLVNSIKDKDFYNCVVDYLKSNNDLTLCPICKKDDFNIDEVIEKITKSLTKLLKDEIILDFDKYYNELDEVNNSNLYKNIESIYNDLLKSEVNVDLINETILVIEDLVNNYDYYLLKYINYNYENFPKEIYKNKMGLISEINTQNREYSQNDEFIDKLNQMFKYVFENDEFRAEKYEYKEDGNNYYGIQLIVNGIMKKGISIENFWSEILSESQKTKISLAFLFAVILFNNFNGKVLCIFDDPIDSYDSINKYKMSRIIYEFIEKKGIFENYNYDCYDLIFSHSVEYLRLFNENLNDVDKNNVLYWVMSSNNISEINKDHLFMLRGDFNILNHIINESQNKSLMINTNELISLTPIIREISSINKKVFDTSTSKLQISGNDICNLDQFISNNVIHGYSKNILIKDLFNFILNYIDINIDRQFDNEKLFDYLKSFIDTNLPNLDNMDFYEQIFFKNIISLYIRAKYDYELAVVIKQCIAKYNDKSIEEIHDQNREISRKVAIIFKDESAKNQNMDLLTKVSKAKPMLNDFAHSANIFLTPLIDVTLNEIKIIYNNI